MRSLRALRSRWPRRRGSALVLVLVFTTALAMLALSAIYLTSGATILSRSYERERDLRLVAEAGLALGKSRLNSGASVLPTSGFVQILTNATLDGADGVAIPDIQLNVFVGPTGGGAGSRGRFASVVAEARDLRGGGRFVRRVELAEESFARFAYFTDQELSAAGTPIYFGRGDVLSGPVWSNDNIRLTNVGTGSLALFQSEVGTAGTIENPSYGTFMKPYRQNQPRILLPNTSTVSRRLEPIAAAGRLAFTGIRDDSLPSLRIEFFAMDMNRDGDSTDANEGFFKAYEVDDGGSASERLVNAEWLKGDFRIGQEYTAAGMFPRRWENCGDWHTIRVDGVRDEVQFFPLAVHNREWFYDKLNDSTTMPEADVRAHVLPMPPLTAPGVADRRLYAGHPINGHGPLTGTTEDVLTNASPQPARCFLGGDPHLIAIGREADGARAQRGGTARTFYEETENDEIGLEGFWHRFPGGLNPAVRDARVARGMSDAAFVFPLHQDFNSGSLGVIHVDGSVGVSGVVNGGVTLYAQNTLHILDDITYATSVGLTTRTCNDILGLISGDNTLVSDNGLNTPQDVVELFERPAATTAYLLDGPSAWRGLELAAVIMSLNTSFRVEGYTLATIPNICAGSGERGPPCLPGTGPLVTAFRRPTRAIECFGQPTGRGCIYMYGGVIQLIRGQVARGAVDGILGFAKSYDYDACAATNPPPFFPTIGRFVDNRFYEIDPLRFTPREYFDALSP